MDTHRIDNPYTGETVAERRLLHPSEVEGLAARSFRAHKLWARTPLDERIALCERFCREFENDAERIASEVTGQMGKPLAQARGEVRTTVFRARTMMSAWSGITRWRPSRRGMQTSPTTQQILPPGASTRAHSRQTLSSSSRKAL